MGSRAQYVLRIAGRVKGNAAPAVKTSLDAEFDKIFGKEPVTPGTASFDDQPGPGWPNGVVLKNYLACQWRSSRDKAYAEATPDEKTKYQAKCGAPWPDDYMYGFRAEIHHHLDGSLYLNREKMLPDVKWFYHNREYKWHCDLVRLLWKLNEDHKTIILERIWFREWQWYCGNGGC